MSMTSGNQMLSKPEIEIQSDQVSAANQFTVYEWPDAILPVWGNLGGLYKKRPSFSQDYELEQNVM